MVTESFGSNFINSISVANAVWEEIDTIPIIPIANNDKNIIFNTRKIMSIRIYGFNELSSKVSSISKLNDNRNAEITGHFVRVSLIFE